MVGDVERIRAGWEAKLSTCGRERSLRSDAGARRVLDLLPRHLVLTAPVVAEEIGLTRQGAGTALRTLVDAGVLTPHPAAPPSGRGRPAQRYVSEELLGLAGSSPLRR